MSARNPQKKPEIRSRQAAKTAAIASHGAVTRRADRSSYRLALLAGASTFALLAATLNASARPLGSWAPTPSAAAVAAAQSGSQEAARAALQAQESMRRATLAVQAMQARQAAAREAERAAHGSISNGLRPGGLQVAPGAVPGSNLWQGADLPTQLTNGGRTEVTVKQNQQKAILTWETFNVGKDTTLYFNQRAGSGADGSNGWMALNRVIDPAAAPSKILGAIKAEGQVYVINQNGIIFGGASQINVGSLVASSLNLPDATFKGTLADTRWVQGELPVFFAPETGFVGDVKVERGAKIVAERGGRVMLLGQNVLNSGEIQADDGQVALVAGRRVLMRASDTSNLRGFEFEINGRSGGITTNDGQITARRGNISLVGLDVEQKGVAMTTTSVTANGSITLHARDSFAFDYTTNKSEYDRAGTVTIGEGSLTSIRPELDDPATIAATKLTDKSTIDIVGRTIQFQRDSLVQATGGDVSALAVYNSTTPGADTRTRLFVEEGAWIDVSGSVGVEVPTERNIIEVNLRGNELRDSPLQRNSFLYGKTIRVDMRQSGYFTDDLMKNVEWFAGEPGKWYGTPLADMSGYIGLIRRDVGELTVAAGTIKLQTSGDFVTKAGSLLTASGGSINYTPGYVSTTQLVGANGRRVDISAADPAQIYVGIAGQFTREHGRWGVTETWRSPLAGNGRYEAGYTQGATGGTVNLTAPRMQLNGAVGAQAGASDSNRAAATLGGALIFGNDSTNPNQAQRVGDVRFQAQTSANDVVPDFTASTPLPTSTLALSTDMLTDGGFGRLEVYSDGVVEVAANADLRLPVGGSVLLAGANVKVDGRITTHGGTIRLSTLGNSFWPSIDPTLPRDITLGSGAVLDVSGLWANGVLDRDSPAPLTIDGGRIELIAPGYAAGSVETPNVDAGVVTLAEGSFLNAMGGGQLTAKGVLKAGNGGSIALRGKELHLDGAYTGDALGKGGTLSLTAKRIQVGGTASAGTLAIDPALFRSGFGKYELNGYDSFVVAPDTKVVAERPIFQSSDYTDLPSGSSLVLNEWWPTDERLAAQRQAVDLSFSSSRPTYTIANTISQNNVVGTLDIGNGAEIIVDAGASVALSAGRLLTISGKVTALGGKIDVSLTASATSVGDPGRSIWLKAGSLLDVSGTRKLSFDPNYSGVDIGSVMAGGTVAVNDNGRGAIVTEAGSTIDVSGAKGDLHLPPYGLGLNRNTAGHATKTEVFSDAGSIEFTALNGMSLNGGYLANGGGATSRRGTLSLFSGNVMQPQVNTGTIEVLADAPAAPSGAPGSVLSLGNTASVSAAALSASGFDDIGLQAGKQVTLEGGTALDARRSITIDAPNVSVRAGAAGAIAQITAGNVSLGNANDDKQTQQGAATAGPGVLQIKTNLLDIVGNVSLLDIGRSVFDVSSDVRLSSRYSWIYDPVTSVSNPKLMGMFATAGDLEIIAAQIYPTVLSDYTLSSTTSIAIRSSGGATPVPLSAGGSLTISAPTIVQGGVVRSPLGAIKFDAGATGTVTLAPGSLTSVSAEGALIPMGRVRNGDTWYFGDVVADVNRLMDITVPPEKRVEIAGRQVDMQAGSRVDVSGGGDTIASEWVPGTGGSRDILTSKPGAPVFSVVPGYAGPAAPVDRIDSANTGLNVGDSVYLAGVPGLVAGWYTLLPGHYALLPGAFRVTVANSAVDIAPTFSAGQPNGSYLVSGRFGVPGIGAEDSRSTLLRVMSGDVVRKFSEYRESTGTKFFAQSAIDNDQAIPRLAVDAGQVILSATQDLRLDGLMNFAAGKDGRGGLLDIAAESIAVIGTGEGPVAGYALNLRGDVLSRTGAESLLLGGKREQTADGVKINPIAHQILVSNDEATALVGPEIILVAGSQIVGGSAVEGTGVVTVEGGSVIRATGKIGGQPSGSFIIGNSEATSPNGTGMGALLIASTAGSTRIVRNDIATATGPMRGILDVQEGAVLQSDGRLVLDATGDVKLASGAALRAKALDAGSSLVSFGNVPNGTAGLVLTPAMLASLSAIGDLTLRGYGTMDFWGALNFGDGGLKSLTLDAGAFVQRATGDVSFRTDAVTLRNHSGTVAASDNPVANGTLSFEGKTITIDAGQSASRGFGEVKITAEREIVFAGKGGFTAGTANHTADLTLSAPRLTAKTGADQGATATGLLATNRPATVPADLAAITEFGGALTLKGARVVHGGTIDMPTGTVRLEATGPDANDDVTLAAGSVIDVKAFRKMFFDQEAFASAGTVELKAASGDAVVNSGAMIDLSAVLGGNAGELRILVPNGEFRLAGDVRASAKPGAAQGSFTLDTARLPDFGGLMAMLNAGGFFDQRHLTIRSGDIVLDGTTQARDLQIVADAGRITVRGNARLLADGEDGGAIRLVSRDDLQVGSGALISARGSKGKGGRIDLETAQGSLDLVAGSTLDVSGATLGGKVHVRAPRTGEMSGTIRAVHLDSAVIGAQSARAEAFWVYDGVSTIDQTVIDAVTNAANGFMAQAPARIGNFDLAAGIELRSSGDMTLATAWDLHDTRPGGMPGYLTLRAAGSLLLNESLSDGFDGIDRTANLLPTESWSYRFVGGARTNGADVFALHERAELAAAGTGDVVVGANATIRTGTGDIQIAAGRSVVIKRENSTPELFNPANPLQVISLNDAITADGLALQTAYQGWQMIAGGANYFYDPGNPTAAIDLMQAFRADGRLNPAYRGWRSVSGMDVYIENPADPSQRIHFLDAFDANGVLLPQYRGWNSRYANGRYSVTFNGSDPDGGSVVTDIMDIFRPDGTVDLKYLGWSVKPGTTTTICYLSFLCDSPAGDFFEPVDISVIVNADGSLNPNYSWWQSLNTVPKMTVVGASAYDKEGTIYTAGRRSNAGTLAVQSILTGNNYSGTINFAERGGDLSITAQQDVHGPKLLTYGCATWSTACSLESQFNRQFIADWLLRRPGGINDAGGNPVTSAWGVDFSKFTQGVGTLGGGDVSINAGNDIVALTAVASDNGKVAGGALQTWGGGNLTVAAGRNADANVFYVAQGQGRVNAGGTIGAMQLPEIGAYTNGYKMHPFATMLALGRGSFDVQASGDISIGGMFNPTMVGMEGAPSDPNFNARPGTADGTYFSTYAPDSSLNVQSSGGQVVMSSIPAASMMRLSKLNLGGDSSFGIGAASFFFYAPQVRVVSLQSDIVVGRDYRSAAAASGRMTLFPAQNGNLTMLAARNIDLTANSTSGANSARGNNILVSDADPTLMPGVFNPGDKMFDNLLDRLTEVIASNESGANEPGKDRSSVHAPSLHRANDVEPVRIYALEGSILSSPISKSYGNGIQIVVPKPAVVRAGLDIENLIFAGQHFDADDVTVIEAGRDIRYTPHPLSGNSIQLGGPGLLDVSAGRNIKLSNSDGIYSVGNGLNPWLVDGKGASVAVTTAAAGGIAYDAFAERYLNPASAGGVGRLHGVDIVALMKEKTGRDDLTEETAWQLFKALPETTRRDLVRRVFFAELGFVGAREAPKPVASRNYNDGYDAVAALFPSQRYAGNLSMFYSQIKTQEGGDISLLVPGGNIDIGLTFVTPDITGGRPRAPGDLGLMTLWGGGINTFSSGSVLVNQNRVKTLGGGDIVMWSSEGDIDAGRGAKTALIAPRPETIYDPATGSFTTKLAGEAAGSGIGTVKSRPDVPAGDVYLIAPHGTVDAGDAGIQSSGSVIIAAQFVRNADNISATVTQIGVPTNSVDTGALTQASNTSAATQQTAAPGGASSSEASIIIVEFLGFGGSQGNDEESLQQGERRKSSENVAPVYNPRGPVRILGVGPLTDAEKQTLSESERQGL